MGKHFTQILAADLVAVAFLVAAPPLLSADPTTARVVVHIVDYAAVPHGQMRLAQKLVADVYRRTGVSMTFEDGRLPIDTEPGVLDLQVSFLTDEMADQKIQASGLSK